MKFEEMFAELVPKRNEIKIGNHSFYARPMTVNEFSDHVSNPNKNDRDDIAILNCIEDEAGKAIFESIEQVKLIYSTVRSQLAAEVAAMTVFLPPEIVEKTVKKAGSNSSNTVK